MPRKPLPGTVGWTDLTVRNAQSLKDFYASVVGWVPEEVDMGGYSDFNMSARATGEPAAGICHARGVNAQLPPVWLVYFVVEDLKTSLETVVARGGRILMEPRRMGPESSYAVIQDPAGAVAALYQAPEEETFQDD